MANLGYARVSTNGQDLAGQVAELEAAGRAKIYREKISGAKTNRPELAKLLRAVGPGACSLSPGSIGWRDRRATCST